MAIFTLTEIAEQKTAYKAALLKVSRGQAYDIGGRRLTRADLPEIRETLEWLDKEEAKLGGLGGPSVVRTLVCR